MWRKRVIVAQNVAQLTIADIRDYVALVNRTNVLINVRFALDKTSQSVETLYMTKQSQLNKLIHEAATKEVDGVGFRK